MQTAALLCTSAMMARIMSLSERVSSSPRWHAGKASRLGRSEIFSASFLSFLLDVIRMIRILYGLPILNSTLSFEHTLANFTHMYPVASHPTTNLPYFLRAALRNPRMASAVLPNIVRSRTLPL